MTFLVGEQLDAAIREVLSSRSVQCAVAFWGKGATALFPGTEKRRIQMICNLRSGGTNPFVIEELNRKAEIRQSDNLHAKVYIGNNQAVVTSANASANGLGFEGIEQSRWIEAGVRVDLTEPLANWFEQLRRESTEITAADLTCAKREWNRRRANKPSLHSFLNFDIQAENFPLITWYGDDAWEPCEENIRHQLGDYSPAIRKRLDDAVEVEGQKDVKILRPGRWVLWWHWSASGLPNKRGKLSWVCLGPLVRKAFSYNDEPQRLLDAVLAADQPPPEPFNVRDPIFVQSFRDVLQREEYEPLREDEYEGEWFAPREQLMRRMWGDLKRRYAELASSR